MFKRTPKILEDACLLKENLGNLNSTEVISLNIEKLPQKKDIALFQKKKSALSLRNVRDSSSLDACAAYFSIEKLYLVEGWSSFFVVSYVRAMNY